ncbi:MULTISPECIES: hypothetical protein [unclassified Agromyces]|uniref:hypothetical protein n=1 Tax=unclassified Agromyces TaxID=2639701 RepID=UPI003672846D
MNTALAGSVSTTIRPTRRSAVLGWLARRLTEARTVQTLDRDEQARRHQLRHEARRLREEQFRAGAFARLL